MALDPRFRGDDGVYLGYDTVSEGEAEVDSFWLWFSRAKESAGHQLLERP